MEWILCLTGTAIIESRLQPNAVALNSYVSSLKIYSLRYRVVPTP